MDVEKELNEAMSDTVSAKRGKQGRFSIVLFIYVLKKSFPTNYL